MPVRVLGPVAWHKHNLRALWKDKTDFFLVSVLLSKVKVKVTAELQAASLRLIQSPGNVSVPSQPLAP